jgi:hypothetical protein
MPACERILKHLKTLEILRLIQLTFHPTQLILKISQKQMLAGEKIAMRVVGKKGHSPNWG